MQERAAEARVLIEPFVHNGTASPELLQLLGHALASLGLRDEAIEVLRRVIKKVPGHMEAKLRLAAVLTDSGKPAEGEKVARSIIAQRSSPEACFVLARALMGQNKVDPAISELRRAVRIRPDYLAAQTNLCELLWMSSGDVQVASAELDTALKVHPQHSALRINKARLLTAAQMPAQALAEIEAGLALSADDLKLVIAAAQIALEVNPQRALTYADRLVLAAPDNASALAVLGNTLLANGRAEQASAVADKLLQADPDHGQGIVLQATAWRLLGDPRYRELFDYGRFIKARVIDAPKGWPDLPAYLDSLASGLQRLHAFSAHPVGQSLRQGSQIELDFERSPDAAVRAFPGAIDNAIQHYLKDLGHGGDPLRRRNSGHYRLKGAWSVRLRSRGFHVNHYHPEGWLSSACYIRLPTALNKDGEGWLQFGEPGTPTSPTLPPEYLVKPEPGMLVLFPAYMWHGTVPFSGADDEPRLTIAFDVVPAGVRPPGTCI